MDPNKEIFDLIDMAIAALSGTTIGSFITFKFFSHKNIQKAGKNSKQQTAGDNSSQNQNN